MQKYHLHQLSTKDLFLVYAVVVASNKGGFFGRLELRRKDIQKLTPNLGGSLLIIRRLMKIGLIEDLGDSEKLIERNFFECDQNENINFEKSFQKLLGNKKKLLNIIKSVINERFDCADVVEDLKNELAESYLVHSFRKHLKEYGINHHMFRMEIASGLSELVDADFYNPRFLNYIAFKAVAGLSNDEIDNFGIGNTDMPVAGLLYQCVERELKGIRRQHLHIQTRRRDESMPVYAIEQAIADICFVTLDSIYGENCFHDQRYEVQKESFKFSR